MKGESAAGTAACAGRTAHRSGLGPATQVLVASNASVGDVMASELVML